jgi:iron(III)-salmochelin esterase
LISTKIVAIFVAAFLTGCSNSGEDLSKPIVAPSAAREAPPARNYIEHGPPDGPDLKIQSDKTSPEQEKVSALPRTPTTGGVTIEALSGYKTKAEYFVINSVNYPQAVVAVTLPLGYKKHPRKKYPLVIAFGGAGECSKPPRQGALAWMHYYKTDEAVQALQQNHLDARDFRGLVSEAHLKSFNKRLKQNPYEGIILACPYSPPLALGRGLELPEYEAYIISELIPALKKHYRVDAGRIGVDGVSMGGARSMYYGFKYPEVFASIGSVQGAFGPFMEVYEEMARGNRDVLKKRSIQLVTSDKDVLAPSVDRMHRMLVANGIPHKYNVLTGPHDYIFNQGPGSIALLMFHNEALKAAAVGPTK